MSAAKRMCVESPRAGSSKSRKQTSEAAQIARDCTHKFDNDYQSHNGGGEYGVPNPIPCVAMLKDGLHKVRQIGTCLDQLVQHRRPLLPEDQATVAQAEAEIKHLLGRCYMNVGPAKDHTVAIRWLDEERVAWEALLVGADGTARIKYMKELLTCMWDLAQVSLVPCFHCAFIRFCCPFINYAHSCLPLHRCVRHTASTTSMIGRWYNTTERAHGYRRRKPPGTTTANTVRISAMLSKSRRGCMC